MVPRVWVDTRCRCCDLQRLGFPRCCSRCCRICTGGSQFLKTQHWKLGLQGVRVKCDGLQLRGGSRCLLCCIRGSCCELWTVILPFLLQHGPRGPGTKNSWGNV